jgi:hypothetical protein
VIYRDITAVLNTNSQGYMLYAYSYAPANDLTFPSKLQRTFNTRIVPTRNFVNKNPNLLPSNLANPTSISGISVWGSQGQVTPSFETGVKLTSNYNGNQNIQLFSANNLNINLQPNVIYNAMMELEFSSNLNWNNQIELYLEYYNSQGIELGSYADIINPST